MSERKRFLLGSVGLVVMISCCISKAREPNSLVVHGPNCVHVTIDQKQSLAVVLEADGPCADDTSVMILWRDLKTEPEGMVMDAATTKFLAVHWDGKVLRDGPDPSSRNEVVYDKELR